MNERVYRKFLHEPIIHDCLRPPEPAPAPESVPDPIAPAP
jgi:hypothetical protein